MKNAENTRGRVLMIVARVVVYAILIFLSFLCLFSFYMLIINATRSNAQLQAGFTLLPKDNFFNNLRTPGPTSPSISPAACSTASLSPPARRF